MPKVLRLDGGNDAKETLETLNGPEDLFFIVKRNLLKEIPEYWLSVARSEGAVTYYDDHKTVYTGFHTARTPTDDGPDMDIIFEVTLRRVAGDGTTLLFPEISVETFWTTFYKAPETVVQLYHDLSPARGFICASPAARREHF